MTELYAQPKITLDMKIETLPSGDLAISSDRMFAAFSSEEKLNEFMSRAKTFLVKMHHPKHENNAGFFFILAEDFGSDDSNSSQLAVFQEAMNLPDEQIADSSVSEPYIIVGDQMTNDDVAAAFGLMTRFWDIAPEVEEDEAEIEYNTAWEAFLDYFLANSRSA